MNSIAGRYRDPELLARHRLHLHRAKQVDPYHLRNAAGIIAVGLVHPLRNALVWLVLM
jgi:hypothetical protein